MNYQLGNIRQSSSCHPAKADVQHLNQRLHYLIQVIQQLTVARDLDSIMAAVRAVARQLTDDDGATFVLRDGDQCYYADEDAISPLWKGTCFPMSVCISGWVMLNQQPAVIADIYIDSRIPADAYRSTFVKSLAMVPIRTRQPLGAIGNYWADHHIPTPDEMQLLQALADAAAVALENVYLYEEQEQRIQERTAQLQQALDFEALLKRITDNVRDSLDKHRILAAVVQELAHGLALSCCSTTLYDVEQSTATVCYEYQHANLTVSDGGAAAAADFAELYPQMSQGETFQFCRLSPLESLPDVPQPLILVCPIVDDQHVLGDIRLYRTSAESFAELDIRLVQQVANQCAIALRQARLHEAVQAQVDALERLNQLKDDFLSTVSHELRSPMTSIRMAVQMLKAMLGVLNVDVSSPQPDDVVLSQARFSKVISYLQILGKECQRETNLINNLLDLTRVEADGNLDILQNVTLQEWVPPLAEAFRDCINHQHQQLRIQIPDQLPPLRTSLTTLERILTELIYNACKYTPAGETITISATTTSANTAETDSTTSTEPHQAILYQLMVSNSGVEISQRDLSCIFDKFYRVPNSDPWKHGGTGLGLALIKRLVEQLSGAIEVTSRDNQVCFTVTLPVL